MMKNIAECMADYKILAAGILALTIGFLCLGFWWAPFLKIMAGILPLGLILGGGLAAYLGFEELRDKANEQTEEVGGAVDEVSAVKDELEKLKAELASIKGN
ncbi:MAG: hypothetical protein HQK57_08840 [Deltaproteobacteria bacterium]|nr:hypothetical protein [Deltaproteobacteria bacterium]MBF0525492.1 hypothetical protein [Deltaproteobacteria bacterium]